MNKNSHMLGSKLKTKIEKKVERNPEGPTKTEDENKRRNNSRDNSRDKPTETSAVRKTGTANNKRSVTTIGSGEDKHAKLLDDHGKQEIINNADGFVEAGRKESKKLVVADEDGRDFQIDGRSSDDRNIFGCDDYNEDDDNNKDDDDDDDDGGWCKDKIADIIDLVRSRDLESLKEGFEKFGRERSAELCVNSDMRGISPFTLAAEMNFVDIVRIMTEQRPNLDVPNQVGGWSALHCSSSQGHVGMVEFLVRAGAGLEVGDREGWTALHFSSDRGCLEVVRILIDAGGNINASTSAEQFTPLYVACQAGHSDVVEYLLDNGADVGQSDKDGWTPLHAACIRNHKTVVQLLINRSKQLNVSDELKCQLVNAKTLDGITALYLVAQLGYTELVKLLIHNGAEVNPLEDEGFAPLHVACQGGHLEAASALLESPNSDSNIVAKTETGWRPLHFATQDNRVDIVQLLIKKGAQVNAVSSDGHTALHLAAGCGNLECLKALVTDGRADLLCVDQLGWCPLHHACQNGHLNIVEELLKLQPSVTNGESGQNQLSNYLKRLVNLKTKEGDSSLIISILNNHHFIAKLLIENGALLGRETESDAEKEDLIEPIDSALALHVACEVGDPCMIKLLVSHGMKANAKDSKGRTPLHGLAEGDRIDCIDALFSNDNAAVGDDSRNDPKSDSDDNDNDHHGDPIEEKTTTDHRSMDWNEDMTPSPVIPPPYMSSAAASISLSKLHKRALKYLSSLSNEEEQKTINSEVLNEQTNEGHTALFLAAHCGREETVKHLLHLGAKADIVDYLGWTPLHAASAKGYTKVVQILLTHSGLDVNRRTYHGFTPLYLSIQENHCETTEYLVKEAIADPNLPENQGFCPLHLAAQNGLVDAIEYLMSSGALSSQVDSNGWTALHFAVQSGDVGTVRKLIEHASDVDARTKDGITSLFIAVHKNLDETVDILLQHGARTDLPEADTGLTPLHIACDSGYFKIVQRLLTAGANVEAETKYDQLRPLYMAIRSKSVDDEATVETIVRALLSEGADPMTPTTSGLSMLHTAAQKGMTGVVQALLEQNKADVDALDEAGWTPLMFASRCGKSRTVRALLAAGAKPDNPKQDDKNSEKVDALLLAVQNGHIEIVEALILWSCNINATTCDGTTALYCASQHGDLEMVQMLLFNGADPNLQDNKGFIPLHPACLNGHRKVAESLVKAGSEVDHSAGDGSRPIQFAERNGHEEIVEWLLQEGAKPHDYEERLGLTWNTNVVSGWGSFIKNVLVKAYKHGFEDYVHLSGDDDESDNLAFKEQVDRRSETLKRVAAVEKLEVDGGAKKFYARGRRKSVIAGTARQVHRV